MANGFKFKLQGLLKLREFKEHKVKVELGAINNEIQRAKDRIVELNGDIDEAFKSQNKIAEKTASALNMQFYAYYYDVKLGHIKALEKRLEELDRDYQVKLKEMNKVHAEYKVISNMKEKAHQKYCKNLEKKQEMEKEELIQMRLGYKKFMGGDI